MPLPAAAAAGTPAWASNIGALRYLNEFLLLPKLKHWSGQRAGPFNEQGQTRCGGGPGGPSIEEVGTCLFSGHNVRCLFVSRCSGQGCLCTGQPCGLPVELLLTDIQFQSHAIHAIEPPSEQAEAGRGAAAAARLVGPRKACGAGSREPGARRHWRDGFRQNHSGVDAEPCARSASPQCASAPLPQRALPAASPRPAPACRLCPALCAPCRSHASCMTPAWPRAAWWHAPSRAGWRPSPWLSAWPRRWAQSWGLARCAGSFCQWYH